MFQSENLVDAQEWYLLSWALPIGPRLTVQGVSHCVCRLRGCVGSTHAPALADRDIVPLSIMKKQTYTLFVASTRRGTVRRIAVPLSIHVLARAVLAVVGGITVMAAVASYTRMLWKVGNYDALLLKQDHLQRQYQQLQNTVKDTDQRLSSLQSLATEVAMTYGFMYLRTSPFGLTESAVAQEAPLDHTLDEFNFLAKNVTTAGVAGDSG